MVESQLLQCVVARSLDLSNKARGQDPCLTRTVVLTRSTRQPVHSMAYPYVEHSGVDAGGGGGLLWAALQPVDIDPEVAALHRKLGEINQRLMRGDLVDNSIPEWERSPSPEPTYDRMGNRTNTREVRAREKMQQQRIDVIEELIAKCPTYRCASHPLLLSLLALKRACVAS